MERYILIYNKLNKKAQAWSLDVLVAVSIFLIAIVILFFYAYNFTNQSENNIDNLSFQGHTVSEILLSEDENGLLSDGIINQTKLDNFYNLDYLTMRSNLGVTNDFFITLDDLEVNGVSEDYIGLINESDVDDLIKVNRIVAYKNKPSKFQVFIWRNN